MSGARSEDPARLAMELYRGAPTPVRAHVWVRRHTCPFDRVAATVPAAGRVLDVGCGHGLFSAYLALQSRRRSVRGIDVDTAKIGRGQEAVERARRMGADLRLDVAAPGELPEGPWDAVVIVDVLYLLDEEAQVALLEGCSRRLAPGGVLVVKEMADRPRWKFRWNRLQETVSVRLLGITEGRSFTFLPPSRLEEVARRQGLDTSTARLDRGWPHPHHLLVAQRPIAGSEDRVGAEQCDGEHALDHQAGPEQD